MSSIDSMPNCFIENVLKMQFRNRVGGTGCFFFCFFFLGGGGMKSPRARTEWGSAEMSHLV